MFLTKNMSTLKRILFSIFIIPATFCNFFGVFSTAWVMDQDGNINGLFPFSDIRYGWFIAASVLMYASFLSNIIVAFHTLFTVYIVKRNGFSPEHQENFVKIAVYSLFITILTAVAVILFAVNLPKMDNSVYSITFGFSEWYSVAAAVCYLFVAGLSFSFAYVECTSVLHM